MRKASGKGHVLAARNGSVNRLLSSKSALKKPWAPGIGLAELNAHVDCKHLKSCVKREAMAGLTAVPGGG